MRDISLRLAFVFSESALTEKSELGSLGSIVQSGNIGINNQIMFGLYGRAKDPKDVEEYLATPGSTMEGLLLKDNIDSFFKNENEVVTQ